ncbi:hypothetical protein HYFRA_00009285 [Hymenoscyphus fraxineus]|uniref:Uncharacterized protein n=1 Tax=Hymenoscyphus fraxineus TaxID=746836 RepID=A0A9N9L0W8_9HELO|nr:hypothetical protein HYFRA_00009285 [Hymenoscyphus fraxineus]
MSISIASQPNAPSLVLNLATASIKKRNCECVHRIAGAWFMVICDGQGSLKFNFLQAGKTFLLRNHHNKSPEHGEMAEINL